MARVERVDITLEVRLCWRPSACPNSWVMDKKNDSVQLACCMFDGSTTVDFRIGKNGPDGPSTG